MVKFYAVNEIGGEKKCERTNRGTRPAMDATTSDDVTDTT